MKSKGIVFYITFLALLDIGYSQDILSLSIVTTKKPVLYRILTQTAKSNWGPSGLSGHVVDYSKPFIIEMCSLEGGQVVKLYCFQNQYLITEDNLNSWIKYLADMILSLSAQGKLVKWKTNDVDLCDKSKNLLITPIKGCIDIWSVDEKKNIKLTGLFCVFPVRIEAVFGK